MTLPHILFQLFVIFPFVYNLNIKSLLEKILVNIKEKCINVTLNQQHIIKTNYKIIAYNYK